MKKKLIFTLYFFLLTAIYINAAQTATTMLYDKTFNADTKAPEILFKDGAQGQYTDNGLVLNQAKGLMQLNYYYSLGERSIRYHVRFSGDAVVSFRSNTGDQQVVVDMKNQTLSINSNPKTWRQVNFLKAEDDYMIEIGRCYNRNTIRLVDLCNGEETTIDLTNDGPGGSGVGTEGSGLYVNGVHDYYCVALQSGSNVTIERMTVMAGACNVHLLIYGDSITEPEGYYPASYFCDAWTQLVMKNVRGRAMCSGRGGCQIKQVIERIKNELPFIKAKYVMVTIGTNGGNTEKNLSELVEYIISQGSTPILNNIPCNESGSQVACNAMIEKIRQKYHIKGCLFDLATSTEHDGKEVDKTTMFHEDLSAHGGPQIYHHPNRKGARLMYLRTLVDTPEIYN